MNIRIYDFNNREKEVEVPVRSIDEIEMILVDVVTGDEIITVYSVQGDIYHFDSSNDRTIDYFDCSYIVKRNDVKRWIDFNPSYGYVLSSSYERMNKFHEKYNLTKTDRVCIEYCLKVVYSIKTMMDMPNRIFKKLIDSAEEVRE